MHIIFIHVNHWQLPLIKLLKYFHFKVFYLFIESKNEFEQKEIANELKKKIFFLCQLNLKKKFLKRFILH